MGQATREARVEEVFNEKDISVFERIGDVDEVYPYAGASLLRPRKVLCYTSKHCIPYDYNVDTKKNERIYIEQKVYVFSPLMGIDYEVKAVLQDDGNMFTYTLGWDNKVTRLYEVEGAFLIFLFVSFTHPKDLSRGVLRYDDYLIKEGNRMESEEPIYFESSQSVIRIYKNIFLLYDMNAEKWVLFRILTP